MEAKAHLRIWALKSCKPITQTQSKLRYRCTGCQKNWHAFLYSLTSYALTLSNIDRFLNLFHCLNQDNICNNNTVSKDPTTPQVCR